MKRIMSIFIIILIFGLTVNSTLTLGEVTEGTATNNQEPAGVYHVVVHSVPFVVFVFPGEDGKVPTKGEVISMLESQLNGSSLNEYYASTLELNGYPSSGFFTSQMHTPPKAPIAPQFALPPLPVEIPAIAVGGTTLILIGVPALIALVLIIEYRDDIEDKVKNEYDKIKNTKYGIEIREAINTFRKRSFKTTGRMALSASTIEVLLRNSTIPSLEPAISTLKKGNFVHFIDHMLPAIAGELVAVQVIREKYGGQIREISKNGKAGPDFRIRLPKETKIVPWEAKGRWWRSPNGQLKRGYCQIQKYTDEKRGYVSVLVILEKLKEVLNGDPSVIFIGWYDKAGLVDCNKY